MAQVEILRPVLAGDEIAADYKDTHANKAQHLKFDFLCCFQIFQDFPLLFAIDFVSSGFP